MELHFMFAEIPFRKSVFQNKPPIWAWILRISKKTLQVYRDKGILPYSRIKHKIFFKTEDVHKLLESNYYHLKREL